MSDSIDLLKTRMTMTPDGLRAKVRDNRKLRPPLLRALRRDGLRFAAMRGERYEFRSRPGEWINALRLVWASDDYLGVALYRTRTALYAAHVPILPKLIHRLCILFFGMRIGDHVVIGEGLYLPHGNIVVDGVVVIGSACTLCPWTTLGLKQGNFLGPKLGNGVFVGTGAKILGDISVGDGANIGAGAVVVDDVPDHTTVAGVPARPTGPSSAG